MTQLPSRDWKRERFADFWKNREMNLYDLRVETHRSGSLRGSGRKLRRVVDERQAPARQADGPTKVTAAAR